MLTAIKTLSLAGIGMVLFSCNMKSAERAELEKMKALDSLRNEISRTQVQVESDQRDLDFQSPGYQPAEPVSYAPATPAKKKMSTATKGALIGAGAGAVSGAVIDGKKPVRGAVLGGVIGAGAGAATGAVIEKKRNK